MSGTRHLYSALNLDAVRLFRNGDDDAARDVAAKARALEAGQAAERFLTDLATRFVGNASLHQVITVNYDALLETLTAVTLETESQRGAPDGRSGGTAVFGRVVRLQGDFAHLALEQSEETFPMPVRELGEWHVTVGAGVAVRWEGLGPGKTLFTAAPAIDVESDAGTHPYDRPRSTEESRVSIPGLLRSTPTMRRPLQIPIAGDK